MEDPLAEAGELELIGDMAKVYLAGLQRWMNVSHLKAAALR